MNANIAFMKTLSITGEINFIANSMRMKITSKLHCIVSHASSIALEKQITHKPCIDISCNCPVAHAVEIASIALEVANTHR